MRLAVGLLLATAACGCRAVDGVAITVRGDASLSRSVLEATRALVVHVSGDEQFDSSLPPTSALAEQGEERFIYHPLSSSRHLVVEVTTRDVMGVALAYGSGQVSLPQEDTLLVVLGEAPPKIVPGGVRLGLGQSQVFSADLPVTWSVDEGAAGGSIEADGRYVAPMSAGEFHITAVVKNAPSRRATTTVTVARLSLAAVAGRSGGAGNRDGMANSARFRSPGAVANDGLGTLYVADSANHVIRKIELATGAVTTIAGQPGKAGFADAIGGAARLFKPAGIAIDGQGKIYVADTGNHMIRKLEPTSSYLGTFAGAAGSPGSTDGALASARFNGPSGLTFTGGALYVSELGNHTIRKIDLGSETVSTLAGSAGNAARTDGMGSTARFFAPAALVGDGAGLLYVSDTGNALIRRIAIANADVTTLAGSGLHGSVDGSSGSAQLDRPGGLVFTGGKLLVADGGSEAVRSIDATSGAVSTLAGQLRSAGSLDGSGTSARFAFGATTPAGLALVGADALWIPDSGNHTLRKLVISSGAVTTAAGLPDGRGLIDAVGSAAAFDTPNGVAVEAGFAYLADTQNNRIRRVELGTGAVTAFAGSGAEGSADGPGTSATMLFPTGLVANGKGRLFFCDQENHTIRAVELASGMVTTLAGGAALSGTRDGVGPEARFNLPRALALDGGGLLYVADTLNHAVRRINLASGAVSTLAGQPGASGASDGLASAARFNRPSGIAVVGGLVLVADQANHTLRKIDPATGAVTTVAGLAGTAGSADGAGALARFSAPTGLAADGADAVYVVDRDGPALRRVVVASGQVGTLVGIAGVFGVAAGPLPGSLSSPRDLAVMPGGDLLLVDAGEHVLVSLTK